MPIYEYKCRACGETFESYRSIAADDAEVKCPKCGCKNPYRVLSSFYGKKSEQSCGPAFPT